MTYQLNATVEVVRTMSDVRVIRVAPDGPKAPYCGGQYGSLALPSEESPGKLVKRPYSISTSIVDLAREELIDPARTEYYEFYFNRIDTAFLTREALTPKLFRLSSGDRIFCGAKIVGYYTASHVPPGSNVLLVCTTTGEAANNSIINDLLLDGRAANICHVVVGPVGWDSPYAAEHMFLARRFASFRYVPLGTASGGPLETWIETLLARPDEAMESLGFPLTPERCHVFLCGDPAMIGTPKKLGGWQYEAADGGLVPILCRFGFELMTRFKDGNVEYEAYW